MKKRLLTVLGIISLLSLTACTPDGDVDLSGVHDVVDIVEEQINQVDREEVRKDVINGLDKASDLLDKVSDAVKERAESKVTPTVTPTPEVEETDEVSTDEAVDDSEGAADKE